MIGDAAALDALRQQFRRDDPPRIVIRDAIGRDEAARLREAATAGLTAFYVPNRGRYHVSNAEVDGALLNSLREISESIAGRRLVIGSPRWLRFRHGDYQLLQGDATDTPDRSHGIEATLDFSESELVDADFVYTHGGRNLAFPHAPRSLTLIERQPEMLRYDSYLKNEVGDAAIWRLRLGMRFAATPT